MSFSDRKQKPMHKLITAHNGAQVLVFAGALLLLGGALACGDDDTTPATSGNSGNGGSGGAKAGSGGSSGKGGAGGSGGSGGMCAANAGGPIASTDTDKHCIDDSGNPIKQVTHEAACQPAADAAVPMDSDDGGTSDYGPTMYGSEADDDDCKYHLKWTSTCIEENTNVSFTVTVTKTVDGTPLTKAIPAVEPEFDVFLDDGGEAPHLAPMTKTTSKEASPGVYTLGPIQFDKPGKWQIRFHLRGECVDLTDDSPHGHAAFYINVP
jgi:hypothetical protein